MQEIFYQLKTIFSKMSKNYHNLSKKIWHCQRDSYKENVVGCHPEWNEWFYVLLFRTNAKNP